MNAWDDNLIQFARLLSEIQATQELDFRALCESMDLDPDDINDLFERADSVFDHAKDHIRLKADWQEAFSALRAAGLESDASDPIAVRYRLASDAVNHANRHDEGRLRWLTTRS